MTGAFREKAGVLTRRRALALMPLVGLAALAVLSGCAAEAYPPAFEGYGAVYVDSVPPDVYEYPHAYYGGGYAYLVGSEWYYPTRGGWVVLQREPPTLYRSRMRFYGPGAYGPGAYGPRPRVYASPYDRRYRRGSNVAPPAPQTNVAPPARWRGYPPPATLVR